MNSLVADYGDETDLSNDSDSFESDLDQNTNNMK